MPGQPGSRQQTARVGLRCTHISPGGQLSVPGSQATTPSSMCGL